MNNESLDSEPEGILKTLDAVVMDLTLLYGMSELEATFMTIVLNVDGFTSCLAEVWADQGRNDEITIGVGVLEGLFAVVKWNTEKMNRLISNEGFMDK